MWRRAKVQTALNIFSASGFAKHRLATTDVLYLLTLPVALLMKTCAPAAAILIPATIWGIQLPGELIGICGETI